jgi:CubicO group peptidase (beta-lactamase class C family)
MRTLAVFLAHTVTAFLLAIGAAAAQVPDAAKPAGPAAQAAVAAAAPGKPPVAHAMDAADVNSWLDGFLPQALAEGNIAGAVVVVVKDGQVLTQRGFGVSDVATQAPVDPARTLFRVGSTSKLYTWTAVMQLVEAGKLKLDSDINTYLDFNIPAAFGSPVTLRNLMTHTAGFEEHAKHLFVPDAAHLQSLGDYLKSWVPGRIFPPGTIPAYSNYGAALAGYIVERVSGEGFDAYIKAHIFQPLGMANATFDQPLPAAWLTNMSKSYQEATGPAQAFELIPAAPAGSLSITGADMARFMIAHLNDGQFGDVHILSKATAELMHAQAFAATPPVPGMALGFYHEDRNGHVIIGHAGDTDTFHTDLHLFLNDGTGLFVSFNSLGKDGAAHTARTLLFREFTDRYYPRQDQPPRADIASAKADAAMVAGSYVSSRRSDTSFLHLFALLSDVTIAADAGGMLTFSDPLLPGMAQAHWREVDPFVWQKVGGADLLAATVKDGHVVLLGAQGLPFEVFQPASGTFAPWAVTLLEVSLAILTIAALLWPVTALVRWHYRAPFRLTGFSATCHRLVRLAATVDVALALGWAVLVAVINQSITVLNDPLDPWLRALQVLAALGVLGAVAGVLNLVQVFRDGRGWWAKVTAVALACATISMAWLIIGQRLITASLEY